jgi:hypothetical protein
MLRPTGAIGGIPPLRNQSLKASRLASTPEIPTVDEAGLRGFYFVNWHAIWAPRGTPADVVTRLNLAVQKVLVSQVTLERLANIGQQVPSSERQTKQVLAAYQREEIERWWSVIKAGNISAEWIFDHRLARMWLRRNATERLCMNTHDILIG